MYLLNILCSIRIKNLYRTKIVKHFALGVLAVN